MDTKRRQFLLGCCAGLLGAVTAPGWAWADRIRVLGEPADLDRPLWGGQTSGDLGRWLGSVRMGVAAAHGPLFIIWLTAKDTFPSLEVATLDEARKSGALVITERAQASVPELIVENRGKGHGLLLAGDDARARRVERHLQRASGGSLGGGAGRRRYGRRDKEKDQDDGRQATETHLRNP